MQSRLRCLTKEARRIARMRNLPARRFNGIRVFHRAAKGATLPAAAISNEPSQSRDEAS